MATRPVNRLSYHPSGKKQTGFSLIEVLIASVIGIFVLGSITGFILNAQKRVFAKSENLLLMQSLSDVLVYIKQDARRAGFDGQNGISLKLKEADGVFLMTDKSLSYVYRINREDESDKFRLTSYRADLNQQKLVVCSKTLYSESKLTLNECTRYYSLFDERKVVLTDFSLSKEGDGAQSVMTLDLAIGIKDSEKPETRVKLLIGHRNSE